MVMQHLHEIPPPWIVFEKAGRGLLQHDACVEANGNHHQENCPWAMDGYPIEFFIHTAKKGNQEIYSKPSFQCKRCPKNTFVMHSKIRLPKQLESRTLLYSVFPIAQHIDRPDVPAFTATFELHFKPKWDSHPSSMLPRRIAAKAVLGKKAEGEQRNIL